MIRVIKILLLLALFSKTVLAQDLTLLGEQEQVIQQNRDRPNLQSIRLLDVAISPAAKRVLYRRAQRSLEDNSIAASNDDRLMTQNQPTYKQLGMNNVPVLDQGNHGTCTTFAVTAALDARLAKGDYISQLCLLQLGRHFENLNTEKSGWDGISIYRMFKRIDSFGIMSKASEHAYSCGGVTSYPYQTTPQIEMLPEEYQQHNEMLATKWDFLFYKHPESILSDAQAAQIIDKTKKALNSGHRIIRGTLLPRSDLGAMGAVGWHSYWYDTWVLTDEIAQEIHYSNHLPGHALIVTGYDDNATAIDNTGHTHRGLLTLRNSWGLFVGDYGNFYMTYDYYKALATDVYEID
jgi:hypothetical protein